MKCLTALILFFAPIAIFAQESPNDANPDNQKLQRWSATLFLGQTVAGPSRDLESAMRRARFGAIRSGFLAGTNTRFPYSCVEIRSLMLNVEYKVTKGFSTSFQFGNADLGETIGLSIDNRSELNIKQASLFVGQLVSLHAADVLRVGVGPALYFMDATQSHTTSSVTPDSPVYRSSFSGTRLGLILDFGLRYAVAKPFLIEVNVQYRKVGDFTVGPSTTDPGENPEMFPQSEIRMDHWHIGGGVGIRF